jgi:hypothetical protein
LDDTIHELAQHDPHPPNGSVGEWEKRPGSENQRRLQHGGTDTKGFPYNINI